MRTLFYLLALILAISSVSAQNIGGKWYGKALQDTGELCQTCNFELDLSYRKSIWGNSRTYQQDTTDIRFNLSGYIDKRDTIQLSENREWLISSQTLEKWSPCVKQYMLKYLVENDKEYLIGRGTGTSLLDGSPCIPAVFVFARNLPDAISYIAAHPGTIIAPVAASRAEPEPPAPVFTSDFGTTAVKKITEIEVNHADLELRLRDYLEVDNDTVSIFLNRKMLSPNVRISKKTVSIKFSINRKIPVNELLLFAENLGRIPPNTSEMFIIDGKKSYRVMVESDLQKTAAVYLRYKPE